MKIIFPMSGNNSYKSEQFTYPKPLLDVCGSTMFENALKTYKDLPDIEILTAINSLDKKKYHLDNVIKRAVGPIKNQSISVNENTAGALCTCLLLSDLFNNEQLIISNYDHDLNINIQEALDFFYSKDLDFGVISFESVHPKWSYVRLDEDENIIEASEKNPISKNALVGFYYFKNGDSFIDAAKQTILSAPSDKECFFVSEVMNSYILQGKSGACFKISKNNYISFHDSTHLTEFNRR